MKKLLALVLSGACAGCATQGSVDDLESQVKSLDEISRTADESMGEIVVRLERVERDLKALEFRLTMQQKKLDEIQPKTVTPSVDDIWDKLRNDPAVTPEVRDRALQYVKDLATLAPEKALEEAVSIGALLVPRLVGFLREKEGPARNNAVFVLSRWNPAEAANLFEPYLADGSVRTELIRILKTMPPCEEIRKALLAHLADTPDSWRVTVADALVRAKGREGVKELIAYLYHEQVSVRSVAIEGLKDLTGFDLGYKYHSSTEERRAAAEKWELWWKENEAKFVFPRR
ncbi:MAG: hypothetical protein HYY18_23460 [Planctomycetes bacterium]|nr:hypothetical protein [Planctomycetota bacterium]